MGFLLEPAGENLRLTITAKEGYRATNDPDGNIVLEGPKDAWEFLATMLADECIGEEEDE